MDPDKACEDANAMVVENREDDSVLQIKPHDKDVSSKNFYSSRSQKPYSILESVFLYTGDTWNKNPF